MMARIKPVFAFLWVAGAVGGADKQPLVAVVPLAARSVDSATVEVVQEAISSELVKSRKVRVLERVQMDRILKEQGFQQSGACDQSNCTMEIGRMLAVNQILTGSLGRVGGSYSLSLRLVDVETGEIANSVTRTQKGEIDAVLTNLLPAVVSQLLAPPDQTTTASLPPAAGSSPQAPVAAPKESKSSVVPWVVGGTVLVGAGVAVALLLGKSGSSTAPATSGSSSVEITLP